MSRIRFRQSTIATWSDCPLQAKFQFIDLLPRRQSGKATFGSIVHHCLDQLHRHGDVDKAVAEFRYLWANPEKLDPALTPDYWPKFTNYGSLREKGAEIIRSYHEAGKWEPRKILASEHRFLVPMGRHELTGTVDFVELKRAARGKLVALTDFKTKAKKPTKVELRLKIQFSAYWYASLQPEFWLGNGDGFPPIENGEQLWEQLKDAERRAVWFHLWTNQQLDAGPRDDTDFMRLYRAMDEIEKAVTHNVFVPDITGEACLWCDYTEPCGLPIEPRTYEEEEEDDPF